MKTKIEAKILIVNAHLGLNVKFVENCKKLGFETTNFYEESLPEIQKTIFHKFRNIFERTIKKNNHYYTEIKKNRTNKYVDKTIENLKGKSFDYSIVFRADLYERHQLEQLRKISKTFIAYQYDGLEVSGKIHDYKDLFDKIYVFDSEDLQSDSSFLPLTNCWFSDEKVTNEKDVFDVYYVGVGVPERLEKIKKIQDYCSQNDLQLNAILTIQDYFPEENSNGVSLVHKHLDYGENIELVKKSKSLIDFKLSYHEGLSFRFFEALYYKKKMITNNASVQKYDFYHPNNIFVTDFNDLSGLKDFLEKPIEHIDEEIINKYGIKNWFHYVLQIEPYEKIQLPR